MTSLLPNGAGGVDTLKMKSFVDNDESFDDSSSSSRSRSGSEERISTSDEEGDTTTNTGTDSLENRDEKEIARLIHKESKDVYMWREIVIGMLFITATLLTVGTYILLSREEFNSFDYGFNKAADAINSTMQSSMQSLFESFESLSDVVTSVATNATWPNVTIPGFVIHADHLLAQCSGVPMVLFAPIVTGSNQVGWEAYAQRVAEVRRVDVNPTIFTVTNGTIANATTSPFAPLWQTSSHSEDLMNGSQIETMFNFDVLSNPTIANQSVQVQETDVGDLSCFLSQSLLSSGQTTSAPVSSFLQPIYDELEGEESRTIVGYLQGLFDWTKEFSVMLYDGEAIYVVLSDTCNQTATWVISGDETILLGMEDTHPVEQADYEASYCILSLTSPTSNSNETCLFNVALYPSPEFRDAYTSNFPAIYTAVVASVFCLVVITFFLYDKFVQRRNEKVVRTAARSNAIVSSMFPTAFRDRIYGERPNRQGDSNKAGLTAFLREDLDDEVDPHHASGQPIADLFTNVTLMFADISGFTAWASTREPSQVFVLLESCFHAFDEIAKRRRIFKVETVGDCYVAVAGLPEARKDHAVAVAKFASDCLKKMGELTRKLEVTLGPDTTDLTLRVGLHSGAVTAGVLRGERSRFQLFGDTMNTASRMESTGVPGKIQVSQETAELLTAAGKGHWLKARQESVYAKGKGEMSTFFLLVSSKSHGSNSTDSSSNPDTDEPSRVHDLQDFKPASNTIQRLISDKTSRLIDWNVELLMRYLKMIVARRQANQATKIGGYVKATGTCLAPRLGIQPLDEVVEVIALPEFDAEAARLQLDPDSVDIDEEVFDQLQNYVTSIAALYRDNAFHNFEHASHVTQSVSKLLARIVAPADVLDKVEAHLGDRQSSLHDHTYGITSDPLTQFACCFSALIHDCDHYGVPNMQLVKEQAKIATVYKNKSAAEQNSIDLAFSLLLEDSYRDLRAAICATDAEQKRFRQLVVNNVLATDIMDKDLKMLRNARWDKAFRGDHVDKNQQDCTNRKATIVMEHLIQASDVAHAMQHWHIFRTWNERFFCECYKAFKEGRAEKDPSISWYEGEIGFFDFYIIPLARKLKDCGVFGVSSDEYLNYAVSNRREWERHGRAVVENMVERLRTMETMSTLRSAETEMMNG